MATCELTCQRNISSLSYTLHDLNAHTRYDIFVSAHSGVSEQDTSNADRRIVEIRGRTTGGGMSCYIILVRGEGGKEGGKERLFQISHDITQPANLF